MTTKTLERAEVKALGVENVVGNHEIEFYAIAFSKTPDKQGDMIDPSAADEWLTKFYADGKALPISYRHAALIGAGSSDPFSIIGYAPADPLHVWKDDHGIRIRAILETEINDQAGYVFHLAKKGALTGASAVFAVPGDGSGERSGPDGSTLITKIRSIKEAGLCPDPANDDAFLISVKSEFEELRAKAVDNSPWDGNAAMSSASTAAEYRAICAGERNVGNPDERQHWALPHHKSPGAPPNAAGCRNAMSRLPQTQGLINREAAQRHLEAHMAQVNPERRAATEFTEDGDMRQLLEATTHVFAKSGRTYSTKNEKLIRAAMAMLEEALAPLYREEVPEAKSDGTEPNVEEPVAKTEEADPVDELRQRIAAYGGSTAPA